MTTSVVTESNIRDLVAKGIKKLSVSPGTIVTSSAADAAVFYGVEIL